MTDFIGSGAVVYVGLSSGGYPYPRIYKYFDSKHVVSNQESAIFDSTVIINKGVIHIAPANNSIQVSPVTLSWGNVFGVFEYQLQISGDSQFINILRTIPTYENSIELEFPEEGTYYWRVRYRV